MSGTCIQCDSVGWWINGASVFGLATGTDYGVVFGAFAGSVCVATVNQHRIYQAVAYFITSFIAGVLAPGR